MRQRIVLFLLLGMLAFPARAQTADASVYGVSDVAVDVTADSAAHARDQAVMQAQRAAFVQLLDRVGTDEGIAAKLSDDDIATLVQHFEVQNERASSVRYIGTFTVQFKPNAVRAYLGSNMSAITDTRSNPVVILPVYNNGIGHPILWEETTKWRAAWNKASHDPGLVPVVIPGGGLDDIALLNTDEAVEGKPDSLRVFIEKYNAGGAAVVTLSGNLDKPDKFTITVQRYDQDGAPLTSDDLTLPPLADKNGIDAMLAQGVKQVRRQLEKDWRQQIKNNAQGIVTAAAPQDQEILVSVQSQLPDYSGPPTHLAVTVPIATLAQWTQIQHKLSGASGINHVDTISVQRGTVSIEIEFQGQIEDMQNALLRQNLQLKQDVLSGTWYLYTF